MVQEQDGRKIRVIIRDYRSKSLGLMSPGVKSAATKRPQIGDFRRLQPKSLKRRLLL